MASSPKKKLFPFALNIPHNLSDSIELIKAQANNLPPWTNRLGSPRVTSAVVQVQSTVYEITLALRIGRENFHVVGDLSKIALGQCHMEGYVGYPGFAINRLYIRSWRQCS